MAEVRGVSERGQPPRQRIIAATRVVIERTGLDGVTVRAIAQLADVNIAAVNYYFGSKDALIAEVLQLHMQERFSDPLARLVELLGAGELKPATALQQFLAHFLREVAFYPRTTEAFLHDALVRQEYGGVAFPAIHEFLRGLHELTRDWLAEGDDLDQRITVAQLWSVILFMGVLPQSMDPFVGESLATDECIEKYSARLVLQFFPRAP
jgi:AcrR family transcriptional regulator